MIDFCRQIFYVLVNAQKIAVKKENLKG